MLFYKTFTLTSRNQQITDFYLVNHKYSIYHFI